MSIPKEVDLRNIQASSTVYSGQVEAKEYKRFSQLLVDSSSLVDVDISFLNREDSILVMNLKLSGCFLLTCERCFESVQFSINKEYNYFICHKWKENNLKQIPVDYDLLEVESESLELSLLIEDELILSLPFAPLHDSADCEKPVKIITDISRDDKDKEKSSNPFSVLEKIRRK